MGTLHLVRHGQASFGSDDYDVLSPLGERQSSLLGISWEAGDTGPTDAIAGSLKRHAQTAIAAIDASGIEESTGVTGYDIDAGWNEYDHIGIAQAQDPNALQADTKSFQVLLNRAIEAWMAGEPTGGESYAEFSARVLRGFDDAVARAGSGRRVAVFTSGGPIALVVSHLLTGDASLFQRLNDVVVNASVTTVLVGSTGPRLLAFNEHTHLPKDVVTYR